MLRKKKYPWKQSFRKLPLRLKTNLNSHNKRESIVVFGIKELKVDDIKNGLYKHLGITWDFVEDKLRREEVTFPQVTGKYSFKNIRPYTRIRKDLPMITDTVQFEAPNYGDYGKGTHMMEWSYKKYPRELIAPKEYSFCIHCLDNNLMYEVKIEQFFDRKDENELFFAVNLLQESFGIVDIRSSKHIPDYKKVKYVNWEIFPAGKREEFIKKVLSESKHNTKEVLRLIEERASFITSLKPKEYIYGTSGLGENYWGAKLSENLVVFENRQYGNALYILYENWKDLSKLSRTNLLNRKIGEFDRVFHIKNWKKRTKRIIKKHFGKK